MNKICVALDADGHFMLANLLDRKEVIKLLKEIHDGDYWANEAKGYMKEIDVTGESGLLIINEQAWLKFVNSFVQRATMEIKDYE